MPLRKLLLWLLVASAFVFLFASATSPMTGLREADGSCGLAEPQPNGLIPPEAVWIPIGAGDAAAALPPISPLEWWRRTASR